MAAGTSPIFEAALQVGSAQFTSADTTTKKTVLTGNTSGNNAGSRIDAIFLSTNDTSAVNLSFYLNDGSTDFYIGVVAIPAGSGYTTVIRVEAMATLSPVLGYLVVPSGYTLKAACVSTMTSAKTTDVVAMGGAY